MRNYIVFVMLLIGFMGISQVPILPSQPISRTITMYPYQVITQTENFYTIVRYDDNLTLDTIFTFPQNVAIESSNIFTETQQMLDGTQVNLPKRTSNLFPEPSNVYVVPPYRGTINPDDK